jgi:AAA+ superfamily predicted ATPase
MSQFDFIKEIAKSGLQNDQEKLLQTLNELISYSKQTKKVNFAIQLQSILKEAIRNKQTSGLAVVDSPKHILREEDREVKDFILEKLTSDYRFQDIVCTDHVMEELEHFVQEHQNIELLNKFDLPIANKILFHGPSGCGKTLASYVLAGELEKIMLVVNLGAIVSSKLGETSKNLAKIFKRASSEECIIFIDEFDSVGKIRDYNQDHGEMKRVVNTILQLFDYLPQKSVIIAATNQLDMIDDALLRRFDVKLNLELPDKEHIKTLINQTLKSGVFVPDNTKNVNKIIQESIGLSYYTIRKTLITAVKRSLFKLRKLNSKKAIFDTKLWFDLIKKEKEKG